MIPVKFIDPKRIPCKLCLLLTLVGCGSLATDPPPPSPTPTPLESATPNLVYEDITLTEVKPNGDPLWRIRASFARYEQDQALGAAELDVVEGEIYDSDDRSIRIQAQAGAVYPEEPRLELRDQVQVESQFYRVSLRADRVEWLPGSDHLQARGNVIVRSLPGSPSADDQEAQITVQDLEATADQLTFDLQANLLTLTPDQATDRVQITAASPPLDLQAQQVEWDLDGQQLTAEGNVDGLHRPRQVQLTGDTLISPLTTPQIVVVGNARAVGLETQQQIAAQQLRWDTSTPILEAQGDVFYRQPRQDLSLQGTSGTLNWDTRTAAVQGASTTQIQIP